MKIVVSIYLDLYMCSVMYVCVCVCVSVITLLIFLQFHLKIPTEQVLKIKDEQKV